MRGLLGWFSQERGAPLAPPRATWIPLEGDFVNLHGVQEAAKRVYAGHANTLPHFDVQLWILDEFGVDDNGKVKAAWERWPFL